MPEQVEQAVFPSEVGSGRVIVSATGRVHTAEVSLTGLRCTPERWLALRGTPGCGAWRRRPDRWAVYGGEEARVVATADQPSSDGRHGIARFQLVRRRAEELLGSGVSGGSPSTSYADAGREGGETSARAPARPRLYGGFSFHDGHRAEDCWEGFPAGRFVLPEWEIRTEGEDIRLLVHRLRDRIGNGDSPDAGLREALEQVASRILEPAKDSRLVESVPPGPGSGSDGRGDPSEGSGRRTDGRERTGGDRDGWLGAVRHALRAIEDGELEKVVLARPVRVRRSADPLTVFSSLRLENPASGLFFVQPAPNAAFLGASPELLASVRGSVFRATAVAGSIDRGEDGRVDEELARRLLGSAKDRREQAIVAEDIRERLEPVAARIRVDGPHVLRLARIQHLESGIEAHLSERTHVLDLLERIHPTPAVCGRPRAAATSFLLEAEEFERGWYAGPVGWFDVRGDGAFIPGLRSAVCSDGEWHLFAGAGIVPGSVPEAEWEETELKFRAMRRALGLPATG